MDTEMIDRLFLELSQVTTATTKKEMLLQDEIAALRSTLALVDQLIIRFDGIVFLHIAALNRYRLLCEIRFVHAAKTYNCRVRKETDSKVDVRQELGTTLEITPHSKWVEGLLKNTIPQGSPPPIEMAV